MELLFPSNLFKPSGVLIQENVLLSTKIEFTFSEDKLSISCFFIIILDWVKEI